MSIIKKKNRTKHSTRFRSILDKNAPFGFVEAYKDLRTNLDFVSSVSGVKSILITSALPDESKSTTAINLALALAENHHSVVLVECDLRKPILRRYLKLERATKGLTTILSGNATLEDCIIHLKDSGISVITSGMIPPNPSELLNQKGMETLIKELKRHYDYVLLDTPPITVVTDAAVVGRMADGALLVVRSKFTQAKTVRLAKQRLDAVNIKILGAVLTRFNARKSGWRTGYDYSSYEYGYGQNKI